MRIVELEDTMKQYEYPMMLLRQGDLSARGRVLRSDSAEFPLAGDSQDKIAGHLGIPKNYLDKIPDTLAESTINYFIGVNPEKEFIIEYTNEETPTIISIYDANDKLIKREEMLEILSNRLPNDTEVISSNFSEGNFFVEAVTPELFTEPREGDVTRGGIRFDAHINVSKNRPSISSFLYRLVCDNGMVVSDQQGQIRIRGNTVEEILHDMNVTADRMFNDVDSHLNQWRHLADIEVNNIERLVHRFSSEVGLNAALERRLMEGAPSVTDRTMYGIVNFITEFQNVEGVNPTQVDRLQHIPSNIIGSGTIHRCPECQHLLSE